MGGAGRASADAVGVTVVVPTVGRPSLHDLLAALLRDGAAEVAAQAAAPVAHGGPASEGAAALAREAEILVVDDRRRADAPLPVPAALADRVKVLTGPGAGPAAARNVGWRAARHPWVVFLDDDVVPAPGWWRRLAVDLAGPPGVGGVQGRIRVPLPTDRRPTDWERVTAGLAHGRWLTADMAYRRAALAAVGGFDERFPRAFREDAELAYRVRRAGWVLAVGGRVVTHPVRPESPWVSVRTQRGNADDALLRRLYGPRWRERLEVPPGRRRRHAAVTAAGLAALGAAAVARRLPGARAVVAGAGAAWLLGTAEFAAARIRPGPRSIQEIAVMVATSVAIPPLACAYWLVGRWRARSAAPAATRR
ncbi:MAG TPA: glycosyltransferase [Pilimelia sp.]|nr:glycosyltransferase [Pilimelia sp.]